MTEELDPLLERIDRDLEECDASTLPPLASAPSDPAEAVLALAKEANLQLMPWQESLLRTMYADPDTVHRLVEPPARPSRPATPRDFSADVVIVDEALGEPLPWWRRWWSR